ncbi:CHAT domain-containing protein [Moorena sp. SIO4G3]|uniref:CHAT domain-containing protein n=1 Tax=Moorena sp. SIO4G3 TaxID=2607821 RepID=UPI0025D759D6|nr:CHAT domain-containing protein [Moorena sp. SIO4G3]
MMSKLPKLPKSIHSTIWLGLLTFLIVTMVVPAVAHPDDWVLGSRAKVSRNQELVSAISNPQTLVLEPADHSSELLEQGKTLYEAGRFAEAAAVWQQAAVGFEQQGDEVGQALSLSYLSLADQRLGKWEQAQSAIDQSLKILQRPELREEGSILAQALTIQGSLRNAMGQTESALESWQDSEATYQSLGDEVGILGSQINQAQALQTMGFYRRSRKLLEAVNEKLQAQDDSLLKVKGLRSLGVALQVVGHVHESRKVLEQSLAIAQKLDSPTDTSDILFSLGNTSRNLKEPETALKYYQQVVRKATSPQIQTEAQLNQLSLYLELDEHKKAIALLPAIESNLAQQPPSRTTVYAAVNFAESLSKLAAASPRQSLGVPIPIQKAAKILARAVQQAMELGDPTAQAYAMTQLGSLYEQTQQWSEALRLTENALQIAQGNHASDIAARAAWQLGRLHKQQGDINEAIAAYDSAVKTLQSLRSDLVAINPDVQFSFTETVEPIYRELVELLLQPSVTTPEPGGVSRVKGSGEISQDHLKKAMQVIESLQLAELENFFQEACLKGQPRQIDQIDQKAAVIYPIILPERLEVIVSVPGQALRHYQTYIPQAELEQFFRRMRQSLNRAFSEPARLKLYQQAYDLLIRPVESELEDYGITTLVFVLDGTLRNLPMSALYDGQQYLIEKYSIALSPGLQLLDPRSLESKQIQAITAGLSEGRQGFKPLPAVKRELEQISSKISTTVLLNQEFTDSNLQNAVDAKPFPVLHLATHGQFSSTADETFVLAWNDRINVRQFNSLLRSREREDTNPIELLVLSACQTARGDNRAVLGLAGVAVRSGARSTLATLWAVRDESTAQLMAEFYKYLAQAGVTKAEALRRAQLALLKGEYNHPVYWAPFVLVGNWL